MNATSCRRGRLLRPLLNPIFSRRPTAYRRVFAIVRTPSRENDEGTLVRKLGDLLFKPFDFRWYLANRQVVSFGYRYA